MEEAGVGQVGMGVIVLVAAVLEGGVVLETGVGRVR